MSILAARILLNDVHKHEHLTANDALLTHFVVVKWNSSANIFQKVVLDNICDFFALTELFAVRVGEVYHLKSSFKQFQGYLFVRSEEQSVQNEKIDHVGQSEFGL